MLAKAPWVWLTTMSVMLRLPVTISTASAVTSPADWPASAGAASRHVDPLAKSRPHVIQVDHVAHVRLSFCETKFNRSSVA